MIKKPYMNITRREPSNTLPRTEVLTVQPKQMAFPLLIIVTTPGLAKDQQPSPQLRGQVTLDGNWVGGTMAHLSNYLESDGDLPPTLQVAIGYPLDAAVGASVARCRELTPTPWPEWDAICAELIGIEVPPTGGADPFLCFINDELKPMLEQEFGVHPAQWTLVGHSLGGLFVLHALLSAPQCFRRYFAVGSSLWWRRPLMFDRAEAFVAASGELDISVYLCAGGAETPDGYAQAWAPHLDRPAMQQYLRIMGGIPDVVSDTLRMGELLARRPGCRTRTEIFECENHNGAPFVGFGRGLRWLCS